jgi:HAD superfamily phosphoserine phosphatase-like hydrolase
MIKAVLLDFDGTLVSKDILDVICGITGKEKESEVLKEQYFAGEKHGLTTLIERINFLSGVSLAQIDKQLNENTYLLPNAKELVDFCNGRNIITILNSGNILPVLKYYQRLLGITYTVGSKPKMNGDVIAGISEEDFSTGDIKVDGVREILDELSIKPQEALAIGDSPADKTIFEFAGKSIAIHPKNGIEKYADYVIGDLGEAIQIIRDLNI